jgi:hypothetical protein
VQWTVKNTGTGATDSPRWSDAVYLSTDQTLDGSDTLLGSSPNPSYLAVGDSYSNNLTVTLPRGISGNYYFIVVTDSANVDETGHEDDNVAHGSATAVQLTPRRTFK